MATHFHCFVRHSGLFVEGTAMQVAAAGGREAMRGRGTALAVASLVVIFAATGCGTDGDWSEATPESQGYRWVGSGEPGNFGSAYSFCRSTLGVETQGQRLQGGTGPVITTPGGPNTIPGYDRSEQSTRSDFSSQRQFRGCMESQGWALSAPAPQPNPQPAPPPTK
jgi:hypothetical protein